MNNSLPKISKILLSADVIQRRVTELAEQINRDYQEVDELILIGILRGAFIFVADLARQLNITHSVDFMALASYERNISTGDVRILLDLREPIHDRHVLIVEDILDSGETLNYLYRNLIERKPASIRTCVLTKKQREILNSQVHIDYLGFEIPNVWVVGYGLDYANYYRTLPYIAELEIP
jgi:hypoxanthine phosphoribosyltransferase